MTSLRKQARRKLKSFGFTGDQAGIAWYNQLDALRKNSDLRGKDLRQQAYNNIVGTNDILLTPTSSFKAQLNLPKAAVLPVLGNRSVASTTVVKSVVKPTTFSQAFRDARNQGLKVFDWNGNKYSTKLDEKQLTSDGGEIASAVVVASRPIPKTNPNQIIVNYDAMEKNHPSFNQGYIDPPENMGGTLREKPWTYWDVVFGRR